MTNYKAINTFIGILLAVEKDILGLKISLEHPDGTIDKVVILTTNEDVERILDEQFNLAKGEKVLLTGYSDSTGIELLHMTVLRKTFMLRVEQEAIRQRLENQKNVKLEPARGFRAMEHWFIKVHYGLFYDDAETVEIGGVSFPFKRETVSSVTFEIPGLGGPVRITALATSNGDVIESSFAVGARMSVFKAEYQGESKALGYIANGTFTWNEGAKVFLRYAFETPEARVRETTAIDKGVKEINRPTEDEMATRAIIDATLEQIYNK